MMLASSSGIASRIDARGGSRPGPDTGIFVATQRGSPREKVMQQTTPHYLHRLPNLPLIDGAWEEIDATDLVEIPLLGLVTAGLPIEACPDESSVRIPSRMVRRNTYALRVRGNSMIDCNIHDGDVIIIERYESAENGETAVVMINNQEVTLKKLYIDRSGVRLQPANDTMEPIYLKNDDVQVLGLVMGVMRQPSVAA
jgi:repressor LexA